MSSGLISSQSAVGRCLCVNWAPDVAMRIKTPLQPFLVFPLFGDGTYLNGLIGTEERI